MDASYQAEAWKPGTKSNLESYIDYIDITSQFIDAFQSASIDSFELLKTKLKEFALATGYHYAIRRSKRYRENDKRRNLLVYYHVCFGCTQHTSSLDGPGFRSSSKSVDIQCPSHVNFSSSNGFFKIAKFIMFHNHPPLLPPGPSQPNLEESPYPAIIDCGTDFKAAFPTMSCGSYLELTNRLREFEKLTGSVFIKYSSTLFGPTDRLRTTCRYKKLRYVCIHYGTRQSEPSLRKNQHTTKIGCGSCFSVKCVDDCLQILNFDMRHCHPVDPQSAMLYPRNRRLNSTETSEIEQLLDYNPDVEELKVHIKEKYGKVCTTRDIINMRIRRRKRIERNATVIEDDDINDLVDDEEDNDDRVGAVIDAAIKCDAAENSTPALNTNGATPRDETTLDSLVDICCKREGATPTGSSGRVTPLLQEIHELASVVDEEERIHFAATLRALIGTWRQGRHAIIGSSVDLT